MIQIEHSEDAISGKLAVEGAPAADFYGWLELIDRLERAIEGQAAEDREP